MIYDWAVTVLSVQQIKKSVNSYCVLADFWYFKLEGQIMAGFCCTEGEGEAFCLHFWSAL